MITRKELRLQQQKRREARVLVFKSPGSVSTPALWIDKHNNSWKVHKFTKQEATNAAATLVDCVNCLDCLDCTNCVGCEDCIGCHNCQNQVGLVDTYELQ